MTSERDAMQSEIESMTQLREEEEESLSQVRSEMDDLMVALDIGREEVANVERDIETREEQLERLETQLREWREELAALGDRLHVDDAANDEVPDLSGDQESEGDDADADDTQAQ